MNGHGFYLYEVSKVVKPIETESGKVIAITWGKKKGRVTLQWV